MIVVIPAAGLGTRLLPLTKSVPKELLPAGIKPAMQWVLEEVYRAGIVEIVVVTSPRKPSLRHFLTGAEHDKYLTDDSRLASLEKLLKSLQITFVEQPAPRGLRDAVWRCKPVVGNQSFALVLPDNLITKPDLLKRLSEEHAVSGQSCMAVYPLAESRRHLKTASYIIELGSVEGGRAPVHKVQSKESDSSFSESWRVGIGRYVFAKGVIDMFDPNAHARPEKEENEVPVLNVLADDEALLAVENEDEIWHIGSIEDYFAAYACFSRCRNAEAIEREKREQHL